MAGCRIHRGAEHQQGVRLGLKAVMLAARHRDR
jgi:hypothetical protein